MFWDLVGENFNTLRFMEGLQLVDSCLVLRGLILASMGRCYVGMLKGVGYRLFLMLVTGYTRHSA